MPVPDILTPFNVAPFDVVDLGLMPYADAWALQKEHHARVAAGGRPTLLLEIGRAHV